MCVLQEIIGLAAFCLQYELGDHDPLVHVPGCLLKHDRIKQFVPESVLKKKSAKQVESVLFGLHAKLWGLPAEECAQEYLQQVSPLPT